MLYIIMKVKNIYNKTKKNIKNYCKNIYKLYIIFK